MIRFQVTCVDRDDLEEKVMAVVCEYLAGVDGVIWDNGSIVVWRDNGYGVNVPLSVDARAVMAVGSERPIAWVADVEADV